MRCAPKFAILAVAFVVFPLLGWSAVPVRIPKEGEGYQITRTDHEEAAPAGYEGRTDIATLTAVGNTPATTGKRIVARFKLANQIKICPKADGTSEGTGEFSMSVDSTDAQTNGTSTTHIEMRANATYKGQVGDNAYLDGPVKAEIDYTYDQSGRFRDTSGAIATPVGSHVVQHITIPVTVIKGMNPPELGAFSGGDPTAGHYAEAMGVGMALTYWGGIYYSVAELRWLQGECAQVVFSPPSNSLQPPLGTEAKVKVEVKTKAGESSKGNILVHPRSNGGAVDPGGGPSDVGAPLKLTYTAPEKKVPNAGFSVTATSRAGAAQGEWKTGLGTSWSGQITCKSDATDGGQSELQTFSSSQVTRVTIDVKNGVATATGYGELNDIGQNKQKALRGNAIVLITSDSYNTAGSAEGTSPATVNVSIDKAKGKYSIGAGFDGIIQGKQHTTMCGRDNGNCRDSDTPFYVASCFTNGMTGSLSDPNQLHGSINESKPGGGRYGKGTQSLTVTWDLGRQGTSQ